MSRTSTLTLLGQANESETMMMVTKPGKPDGPMTKSQLNMPIETAAAATTNGLRIRDSAIVYDTSKTEEESQVISDENNNVVKGAAAAEETEEVAVSKPSRRMWGFFKVDQPVKTLNSILIPLYHVLAMFALANITLDTKLTTIAWGESLKTTTIFVVQPPIDHSSVRGHSNIYYYLL